MVVDRLEEYRKKAGILDATNENRTAINGNHVDTTVSRKRSSTWHVTIQMPIKSNIHLDCVLTQVNDVKKLLNNLKSEIYKVKDLHKVILSTPFLEERKKVQLDEAMEAIKFKSHVVKTKLKDMKVSNLSFRKQNSHSAIMRVRDTHRKVLLKAFVDLMFDYHEAQKEFIERSKTRIRRQSGIVGLPLSDEEIEKMAEQVKLPDFTNAVLPELERHEIKLKQATNRRDQILQLEKSIIEMHDLFVDISILVEHQGLKVDTIAMQVDKTKSYVVEGNGDLKKANKGAAKKRKRRVCISITLTMLALFLCLVIYFVRRG